MNAPPPWPPATATTSKLHAICPDAELAESRLEALTARLPGPGDAGGRLAGLAPADKPRLRPRPAAAVSDESMPPDFTRSPDEPWRPREPRDWGECGIRIPLVEGLILRRLLSAGESEGRTLAEELKLPFRLVEPLLTQLKSLHRVAYKTATATNDYVYVLTEAGRQAAYSSCQHSTYVGSCPVPLADYITSVRYQSIEAQHPKQADLEHAFADLLINPQMLAQLGPAINSGRGMFLFGHPGNGKSSIAERVTAALGKYIWVPRTLEIDGAIMQLFDPMMHQLAIPETAPGLLDSSQIDKRWVRIKRPTIAAGGELTLEMLEVQHNSVSGISEAPLQMKSNCGTLVIDDFGRQKMSIAQLLNRWIVPLEKRHDYLHMASGKKVRVPFDQLVIFSTNLEPRALVDEAFLRRIPYKIEVTDPLEGDFRRLLELVCAAHGIAYEAEVIDYLIRTHYLDVGRPFRNCHPRDLLLQVKHYCFYHQLPLELTRENLDFAVFNYFSVM